MPLGGRSEQEQLLDLEDGHGPESTPCALVSRIMLWGGFRKIDVPRFRVGTY
jgi:hypothetical protein